MNGRLQPGDNMAKAAKRKPPERTKTHKRKPRAPVNPGHFARLKGERDDFLETFKALRVAKGETLAHYAVSEHGSVYALHWHAGHTIGEGIGWFKDGWYKACIPHFFGGHVFRKLREHDWYRVCLELDGYSFDQFKQRAPEFLKELKEWMKTGRLEIVDGTYCQPYSFIISGESNIRQLQYGTQATAQALGTPVKYHLQQEAGFHPQLPQIFKGLGYKGVVLRVHGCHWGWCPQIKEHRIRWQGLDGTTIDAVPTYSPVHPHVNFAPWAPGLPFYWGPDIRKSIRDLGVTYPLLTDAPDMWYWPGTSYTKRTLPDLYLQDLYKDLGLDEKTILDLARDILDARIEYDRKKGGEQAFHRRGLRYCTLAEYFRATPPPRKTAFIPNHDFEYKHVSGIFADMVTTKNKEAENRLYAAELLGALTCALGGPDPSDRFVEAWKLVLSSQNHDVYCIPTSFMWAIAQSLLRRAMDDYRQSIDIADTVIEQSLDQLAAQIDTRPTKATADCIPIAIFNTLSWSRTDPVEVEVSFASGQARSVAVFDGKKQIPCQMIESEVNRDGSLARAKILFLAEDVPSVGYKVYHIVCRRKRTAAKQGTDLRAGRAIVENEALRVHFTPSGWIKSVRDKTSGNEFLDTSAYYGNEFTGLLPELGFTRSSECPSNMEVVETGPVRATVKVTGQFGPHPYSSHIHFYARSRRIDFDTVFDFDCKTCIGDQRYSRPVITPPEGVWNAHDKLRVTFNPKAQDGPLMADMPFAAYSWTKTTILGYNWADSSGGGRGVTLINTGNIGYYQDAARNVGLSLILAYGGPFKGRGPTYLFGMTRFRYALYAHAGDWKAAAAYRRAAETNNPLLAKTTTIHNGELGRAESFIELEPSNVMLSALIPGKAMTLRLFETQGKSTRAAIKLGLPVRGACEANLTGRKTRDLKITSRTVRPNLRGHQILNIKLTV